MRTIAPLLLLLLPGILPASSPLLSPEDEAFLLDQARRVVRSAQVEPGGRVGQGVNRTPYRFHIPGGNMGYVAFWPRDAVMMLGADFIAADELEGWIRLMSSVIVGPKDWEVRPGVVIPAYAVPDHINPDGKGSFYPGNYESGEKQGGPPFGKYPPLDDHFYFITAVYEHWKLTGNLTLFNAPVKTAFSTIKLRDLCDRVFRVAPSDDETGLAWAGDVETENAKDFGFCDGVSKSGRLLFTSTLKFVAARQLAEMYAAAGTPAKAARYRKEAERIRKAIPPTFYHASKKHDREGWLHSATGVCNQPDVWGSAFAIWAGAVDGAVADGVARALVRAYRDQTAVKEGLVSQVLSNDRPGGWEKTISPYGTYQNGGYWGTATGWYIAAIHRIDPAAAAAMARDYLAFLRRDLGPDGTARAYEWINREKGKFANELYVATVALPYASLKRAGLAGSRP